jgi:hypothetical protein
MSPSGAARDCCRHSMPCSCVQSPGNREYETIYDCSTKGRLTIRIIPKNNFLNREKAEYISFMFDSLRIINI